VCPPARPVAALARRFAQEKLKAGKYATTTEFGGDVKLVWRNAKTYNQEGSEIYDAAAKLEAEFESKFAPIARGPLRVSDTLGKAKEIVKQVRKLPNADPFNEPVDWEGLKLDDYLDVIKEPMDLGTIMRRLDSGSHYTTVEAVFKDLELVWSNAMIYNMEVRLPCPNTCTLPISARPGHARGPPRSARSHPARCDGHRARAEHAPCSCTGLWRAVWPDPGDAARRHCNAGLPDQLAVRLARPRERIRCRQARVPDCQ
jgi:hypothetical protein